MTLAELEPQARLIMQRYEQPRAAALPLLWLVQENLGYITSEAEFWVGRQLGISVSHVCELVTFYTMFRQKPAGRSELRVCTSLPCRLRGARWATVMTVGLVAIIAIQAGAYWLGLVAGGLI